MKGIVGRLPYILQAADAGEHAAAAALFTVLVHPAFHVFPAVDPVLGVNIFLLDESGFERLLAGFALGLFEADVWFDLEKATALEPRWREAAAAAGPGSAATPRTRNPERMEHSGLRSSAQKQLRQVLRSFQDASLVINAAPSLCVWVGVLLQCVNDCPLHDYMKPIKIFRANCKHTRLCSCSLIYTFSFQPKVSKLGLFFGG